MYLLSDVSLYWAKTFNWRFESLLMAVHRFRTTFRAAL